MTKKNERRVAKRKNTETIQVNDITYLGDYTILAKQGHITNASSTGFLIEIDRSDLLPKDLRTNLNLESTLGQQVVLYLPQMNLDMDGTITRTIHRGKGKFQVAIDFSNDVPEYWRNCLIELLPAENEFDHHEE
jgi:hypothetical protein